ncbi:UNVERIFIED_CONTAM: hypothetical protein Sradi_2327500 [Sesamum radiatum]|uniref:Reverse transcriptase zinc-binding domain-containing protein n=1 Tax=Sesamum radiatum TaxID=300843 RepID=A0AAW2T5E8_SESRA
MRYLGLPLLVSRLTIADCKPLLLKIDRHIKGWEGTSLSFAGRIKLIKSVFTGLNVHWAMAFILPKGIIRKVEKRLRSFLWKEASDRGYPKVAWHIVCKLIEEGDRGAKLCSAIGDSQWQWPPITDINYLEIIYSLPHIHRGRDMIVWWSVTGAFTTAAAYDLFSPPGPREHIRFVWLNRGWVMDIEWASAKWRGRHVVNAAYRALLTSLAYHFWQERNRRRFQHMDRTANTVAALVLEELRQRIISVDLPMSISSRKLYRLWRIPWPVEDAAD